MQKFYKNQSEILYGHASHSFIFLRKTPMKFKTLLIEHFEVNILIHFQFMKYLFELVCNFLTSCLLVVMITNSDI